MEKSIEELKFVAELAHNGGMMQALNESLKSEVLRLQEDNKKQEMMLMQKDKMIAARDERIAELQSMLQQSISQPTVVVNQFFVLSKPKTYEYVSTLDNNGRRFVGHFIHQALPDGTPMSVIAQVDEMTRLEGSHEGRLADALEDLAKKPTTQVTTQNYNAHVDEQNNSFTLPETAQPTQNRLDYGEEEG